MMRRLNRLSRGQLRRVGRRRAATCPRCEITSFSAAGISALVRVSPSGTKTTSYPKPPVPRCSRITAPRISPNTTSSSPPGRQNATAQRNSAPRRSSGTSASWSSSSRLFAASSLAAPAQRADSTPGIPLSASTQMPLSSASDGSPVAATPARALRSALPSNVGSVSAGSSYGVDVVQPEHLDVGHDVGQDPAQLLELLRVARREEDLAHARMPDRRRGLRLMLGELGAALHREVEQASSIGPVERPGLRPCPAPRRSRRRRSSRRSCRSRRGRPPRTAGRAAAHRR